MAARAEDARTMRAVVVRGSKLSVQRWPLPRPHGQQILVRVRGAGAKALEPGGALVLVGAEGGTLGFGLETVPADVTFLSSISGSMGGLAAVLEHARRGELDWQVDTLPLERASDALARLRRGDVPGRLVLVPG